MKKELFFGLFLVIFVGAVVYFSLNKESKFNTKNITEPIKKEEEKKPVNQIPAKFFSKSQVSAHNNQSDCWLIIDNKVYDVSSYIDIHKGGRVIVNYCGTDATEAFKTKGEKGEPHKPKAFEDLKNLYLGDLEVNN